MPVALYSDHFQDHQLRFSFFVSSYFMMSFSNNENSSDNPITVIVSINGIPVNSENPTVEMIAITAISIRIVTSRGVLGTDFQKWPLSRTINKVNMPE